MKSLVPALMALVSLAAPAVAQENAYVFSTETREIANAMIQTSEVVALLSAEDASVIYAAPSQDSQTSGVAKYRVVVSNVPGSLDSEDWRELTLTVDSRSIIADAPTEYTAAIGAAGSIPFHPQSPLLYDALTALLRNPTALGKARGLSNKVFSALAEDRNGHGKYTFVLGEQGAWLATRETALLVIRKLPNSSSDARVFSLAD